MTNESNTSDSQARAMKYPVNAVIGIVEVSVAGQTIKALRSSGFLDSEVEPVCGVAAAETLDAQTGRSGLANLVVKIAERLSLADEEMEMKDRYETALRDGKFLIKVIAPTAERRELAARVLGENGAHTVNSFGRFTITEHVPPGSR